MKIFLMLLQVFPNLMNWVCIAVGLWVIGWGYFMVGWAPLRYLMYALGLADFLSAYRGFMTQWEIRRMLAPLRVYL